MKSLNDQFTDALEEIGNYGPYQVNLDYENLKFFQKLSLILLHTGRPS